MWVLQAGISGLSLLGGSKGSSREGEDGEGLVLHFGCDCGLMGDVSLCCRKDVQIGWTDGTSVMRRDARELD
jgi:hypothetical protein